MRVTGIAMWLSAAVTILCSESASAQMKINELMYAPSGGQPEWIEIYNDGPDSVNIKGWTIHNKNGVRYALRLSDRYISPHSYLVLTNSNEFANFHPEAAGSYIVVDWSQYFLVNTGDTVAVHDESGKLVDSVYYASSWGGSAGRSLERKSASDSSRTQSNWGTSINPAGSTPGRLNSISLRTFDLKISSFSATFSYKASKAVFDMLVKNIGLETASSFTASVFVDSNGDSIAQSNEVVASTSGTQLSSGDSIRFHLEKEIANPRRTNAIAIIDFPSDEDTSNNRLMTRINQSYPSGSLVVNEIMYAPASPRPEWVELFNTSQDSVLLDAFTLADNSGTKARLPQSGFRLPPSGYVIISDDSTFFNYYPELSAGVIVVSIPSLNNSGDAVVIHDASGNTIDSVAYSPSWGGNSGGKSLERILANGSSNDPQNFETCIDTSKSTPGRINSVTPRDHDLAVGAVSWSPATLQSGNAAVITASILNVGLRTSGNSTAILFQDSNGDLKYDGNELGDSVVVGEISPGDSIEVSLRTGALTFGSHRFGIVVNSASDERISNNSRSFILKVGLAPSTVVINELMYAPVSPEPEWIELYNASNSPVDLSYFAITSNSSAIKMKSGTILAPTDYMVLCKDSSVQQLHENARNLVIQSAPSLSNTGAGVSLRDNIGNLLDTIDYRPSFGGDTGRSLERIDFLAGDDSTNWAESVDPTGATPGTENSIAIIPFDAAIKRLDLSSKSFAPGISGKISVVVMNRGRNAATDAGIELIVRRDLDSAQVFSDTGRIARPIARNDSASLQFEFSAGSPGSHTIFARVSLDNDPRYWNDTLSAKLNVGFEPQSVVINEIMFTKGATGEYFELFNASRNAIDLSGWSFHTSSSASKQIQQYAALPSNDNDAGHRLSPDINSSTQHSAANRLLGPNSHLLLPGEYFVVASDSSIYAAVPDSSEVIIVKSLSLRDDGDCVVLHDPSGNMVDSIYYLPSWHNADIAKTAGRSLEKINPTLPSLEKTSWSTCVSKSGGTPGIRNSLFISPSQASGSISVSPNPFSPDGDGHDDFTFVTYSFPVTSVKIRIRIFDTMGRSIATLADNIIVPSTGRLVWDGRDGSGKIVRFGLYILFMEVTGPDGNSLSIYKKPVVVAKKMK